MSGLVVGVLLQAVPMAAAHGGRATHAVAPPVAKQDAAPAGVCEIDLKRLEAFLAAKADAGATAPRDAGDQVAQEASVKSADKDKHPAVAQNQSAAPCALPPTDDSAVSPTTPAPLG